MSLAISASKSDTTVLLRTFVNSHDSRIMGQDHRKATSIPIAANPLPRRIPLDFFVYAAAFCHIPYWAPFETTL